MKPKSIKIIDLLIPTIPVLAIVFVYSPLLASHFNWEDTMFLGDAAKTLTKGNFFYLFSPWMSGFSRLTNQFIATLFFYLFGYKAQPFFIFAITVHSLNAVLTYFISLKITKSRVISFFAACFYSFYQVNTEPLFWISSAIKELPMTLFFLLSFYSFLTFQQNKKNIFIVLSYLFFGISLASEFKAFAIPLVFVVYELIFSKKFYINKSLIIKFLPYVLIALIFSLTFYRQTLSFASAGKNWKEFFLSFPSSLPLYILPVLRIYWVKIYTNAWGITSNVSDQLLLQILGFLTFLGIVFTVVFLFLKKEMLKAKIIAFFFVSTFICYFPVVLTVLNKFHPLWQTITIHWRYYNLATPMAAILFCSLVFYLNSEIPWLKKFPIFPLLILIVLLGFHIEADNYIVNKSTLWWTVPSKNIFTEFKRAFPVLGKETVFVIEGTDIETKKPYFQHRYLLENLFAMYANPNNPSYLTEQQSLPLQPGEACYRTLKRLLYYTNIKDILVGYHEHIYADNQNDNWITLNIKWRLSAYDRMFLGAIYGIYDTGKIVDFQINEDGSVVNLTEKRKQELSYFLNYYCFDKGKKTCSKRIIKTNDQKINETYANFSQSGIEVIGKLIQSEKGELIPVDKINVPSNIY